MYVYGPPEHVSSAELRVLPKAQNTMPLTGAGKDMMEAFALPGLPVF
jgi:hypothetical protein